MPEPKRKVAVLGGGPAGLAAAWQLTATSELRERFEVTVHQLGWRLGGKCSSGRDAANHERILEHGLHMWFGWYQQGFDLMKRVYDEKAARKGTPFESWDQAFTPFNTFVLMERWRDEWYPRPYTVPPLPGQPYQTWPVSLWQALHDLGLRLAATWSGLCSEIGGLEIEPAAGEAWAAEMEAAVAPPPGVDLLSWQGWLERAAEEVVRLADDQYRLLTRMGSSRDLDWFLQLLDLSAAAVRGVLRDVVRTGRGFDHLDDEELSSWLKKHGLRTEPPLAIPFLRGIYDLAFAYGDGEHDRPEGAAGVALRNVIKTLFGCRGGFMWRMEGGMGDVVCTPLYNLLRAREVKFRFFHWVTELGVDAEQRRIDCVKIVEQARATRREYHPLRELDEMLVWPANPLWDQLDDADRLKDRDLEREHGPLAQERILCFGEHFHDVVLALPAGVHAEVCARLCEADEGFRKMVAGSQTVGTRTLQLWLTKGTNKNRDPGSGPVTGAFQATFDSVADMSQVAEREKHKAPDAPVHIAYFCSTIPKGADDSLGEDVRRFVAKELPLQWPSFSPDDLLDTGNGNGLDRLGAQYWRANNAPTEAYVQTPPGNPATRLEPEWDGFSNLVLAGDWTRCEIDAGCVEAAVAAGRRAGRALARRAGVAPGP